ncbi:peptidylprolyl isomerase [Flammeovirga sp. SJP92]|uniref:peptidylprolyl isomerase n=1 Tax=Flammeovirga sp. SJP92 TaxID=1775430 RepID=UPI000AA63F7D|nr:peptidylprolyl isomerase [Flammeovirga sp. SJP92]
MTKQILLFHLIVINLTILSCTQNENLQEEKIIHFDNKFEDKQIRAIYDLRDQRNASELVKLLPQLDNSYKIEILTALGSVQDTLALASCKEILMGEYPLDVKLAADFAIGQIGDPRLNDLLIDLIINYQDKSKGLEVLFETLGECADERAVIVMSHFNTKDELVKRGIVKGLYRALTRKGIQSYDAAEQVMRIFTSTKDTETREWCSAYFTRMDSKQMVETFNSNIFNQARRDTSALVRANFTQAIGVFSKSNGSSTALKKILQDEKDPSVLVNAILATKKVKYNGVVEETVPFLNHENARVSISAAKVLYGKLGWKTSNDVYKVAQTIQNKNTRALTLKAVMNERNKQKNIYEYTKELYENSSSVYEQSLLLEAMNESSLGKSFVLDVWINSNEKVLQTKAIELVMNNYDGKKHLKKSDEAQLKGILSDALRTKDVGQLYTIGAFMQKNNEKFGDAFPPVALIDSVKNSLSLPLQVEGYIELEKTIAKIQGYDYQPSSIPKKNVSINWESIQNIKQDQEVVISTSKGDITIQLKVEEAPATVAMFVDLIEKKFYDSLYFHRVVPNFVVQGGDPRGDGFGGLETTIPSEFSYLKYKVGSLGIASAGKDTESCQFFMTEVATHHLDGRYTIFAEIVNGVAVMKSLEYGDQIIKVNLQKDNIAEVQ